MSKPPEDIRKMWFAIAHGQPVCAFRGKTCQVLEAHHIIPRQSRIAWMPQNAILLCRHHHEFAHNDRPVFMFALKGTCREQWFWVETHKNKTATWDEVRAELRKWTAPLAVKETDA